MYLIKVVLPTPGGPITNIEPPPSTKSRMTSALPDIARPTRHVRPIICILRFRIALIRCRELSMPERLSSENSPTWTSQFFMHQNYTLIKTMRFQKHICIASKVISILKLFYTHFPLNCVLVLYYKCPYQSSALRLTPQSNIKYMSKSI